jgi:MOSC domain-containing protein YiiM
VGIEGDRYATRRGHWSDPKWPDQQLTLVEAELAEMLGLTAGQLRRNIVTRDCDLAELIGVRFRIGEATVEGVRLCDPCKYIERFTRAGALKEIAAMGGGLRASVVEGGRVRVGDGIESVRR